MDKEEVLGELESYEEVRKEAWRVYRQAVYKTDDKNVVEKAMQEYEVIMGNAWKTCVETISRMV